MEQKTKMSDAMKRSAMITMIRAEASDTVQHSWWKLLCQNILAVMIPVLMPAAFVACVLLMKLPVDGMLLTVGMVCLLGAMAFQAYFSLGFCRSIMKAIAGKEIRVSGVMDGADEAGRALGLYVMGLVLLLAAAAPGAAIAWAGWQLGGVWGVVLMAAGAAAALALVLVVMLSGSMALFIMADDSSCGGVAAILRSARMLKGHKREIVRAVLPSFLLSIGLTAAMALLLWPLFVKQDILTSSLMYAGGVAYVISLVYIFMRAQGILAGFYRSVKE